jgi:hypothetical protein
LVQLILALPPNAGFLDGRQFTNKLPHTRAELKQLVELIEEMGFWNLIVSTSNIESLVRIALITRYARPRSLRALRNVEPKIKEILLNSIGEASKQLGLSLELLSPKRYSEFGPRQVDYVVAVEEKPTAAIKVVLLTNPGGTQSYDLRSIYPLLQSELNNIPMQLILIADGIGMKRISNDVLQNLFRSVHTVISIRQARESKLTEALISAATDESRRATPVDRIIESTLSAGDKVEAGTLPIPRNEARLALAQYINDFPQLSLTLSPRGESISWTREALVKKGTELKNNFDTSKALALFRDLMEASTSTEFEQKQCEFGQIAKISLGQNPILPQEFLVVSSNENPNADLLRKIARKSFQLVPAKLAVLLTPYDSSSTELERHTIQSRLSANVVTIDSGTLLELIKNKKHPRDGFISLVLEQSDLTKISPFVLNNPTPNRMFFGREKEEATILGTLATNSAALLGSRRIGKTSLMNHLKESLDEANFLAFSLDCQTVTNWADFGGRAHHFWHVDLPEDFNPQYLFDLVSQLRFRTERKIVILLDEIDHLLAWDMRHQKDQVPEAFFRACRTISQSGEAQFVFSGERTIATKLWDPHSPHWNFCRPIPLQQLDKEATEKLLIQPLQSLQVEISDIMGFGEMIWKVTSGHPQIVQFLGDQLVQQLNQRPPTERAYLSVKDIQDVTKSFEFKDHYITTYWGQATPLEKLISLLVVLGINSPSEIIRELQEKKVSITETNVIEALRMLDLYGVVTQERDIYILRASWLEDALKAYGELDITVEGYWRQTREQFSSSRASAY